MKRLYMIRKSKHLTPHAFLSTLLIITTLLFSKIAAANGSLIEFTHSAGDDTFGSINSVGLYGNFSKELGLLSYGSVQLAQFRDLNTSDDHSVVRIFAGQAVKGPISPFFEIGTDAYGLLILLLDNNDDDRCIRDQKCRIDAYFRFGIRFHLSKELNLGVYYENIEFGDSHTHLFGSHEFTGASLGLSF